MNNIVLTSQVQQDEITEQLSNVFDYAFEGTTTTHVTTFDAPDQFGIGLIVGPSGSGKSTLLSRFGAIQQNEWNPDMAICSHFANATDAIDRLSAVGLNTIPAWMRPYHALSTGEKFRADVALSLRDGAVIDEFTSTIDRTVAKACSVAINRFVKQSRMKNIVFASCHYDIIDWLQPDWVFDTNTGALIAGRGSERRPEIDLEVLPCSSKIWPLFSKHHYLDGSINKSARCWVALWSGNLVGFTSALAFPNGNMKNAWREHRTVIFPDYQGLGIGVRLSDAIGKMFIDSGCRYFSKTSHPRMGGYRNNSQLWMPTSKNGKSRADYNPLKVTKEDGHKMKHVHRICFSHEYVGC